MSSLHLSNLNHYWLWWDFDDFNLGVLYDSLVIHPISQKYCISSGFSLAMLLWHKLSCHFFHTKWRLILFILTGQIVKHWLWLGRSNRADRALQIADDAPFGAWTCKCDWTMTEVNTFEIRVITGRPTKHSNMCES